jgi:hypothetical protein
MPGDDANIKGRSTAFGTLTPFQNELQRLRTTAVLLALHLRSNYKDAEQLSFLHHARWVVLPRRLLAQRTRPRLFPIRRSELLFMSTFNGDWTEYLTAFSRVLTMAMDLVWSASEGWPGARHQAEFKDYVEQHALRAALFCNNYGSDGVGDVRSALRVSDALDRFALELDPRKFQEQYEELLYSLSPDLGA